MQTCTPFGTDIAHCAPGPFQWANAQLPRQALQPRKGHHSIFVPCEASEPDRIHERAARTSPLSLLFIYTTYSFSFRSYIGSRKLVLTSSTSLPHLTLFPQLAPRKLALSSARLVILVVYKAERGTIDGCHFRITIKRYSVSRRILQGTGTGTGGCVGAVLDLGNERDVGDYVLRAHGGGYETAASEVSSVAEGEGEG